MTLGPLRISRHDYGKYSLYQTDRPRRGHRDLDSLLTESRFDLVVPRVRLRRVVDVFFPPSPRPMTSGVVVNGST